MALGVCAGEKMKFDREKKDPNCTYENPRLKKTQIGNLSKKRPNLNFSLYIIYCFYTRYQCTCFLLFLYHAFNFKSDMGSNNLASLPIGLFASQSASLQTL